MSALKHAPIVQIHLERAKAAIDLALSEPLVCGGHITKAIVELEAALSARRDAVEQADFRLDFVRAAGF